MIFQAINSILVTFPESKRRMNMILIDQVFSKWCNWNDCICNDKFEVVVLLLTVTGKNPSDTILLLLLATAQETVLQCSHAYPALACGSVCGVIAMGVVWWPSHMIVWCPGPWGPWYPRTSLKGVSPVLTILHVIHIRRNGGDLVEECKLVGYKYLCTPCTPPLCTPNGGDLVEKWWKMVEKG